MADQEPDSGAAGAVKPAETAGAAAVPVPELVAPADPPPVIASSAKADVFSVAASAIGHLLVGLLIFGSLSSIAKIPDIIPVKLVPADQVPPKPPKKPPDQSQSAAQQQQKQSSPPKTKTDAAKADAAKGASAGQEQPPPPKAGAADQKKAPSWKDIAASLGMAEFGRKTTLPQTLLAELTAQAKRCWSVPDGWSDPHEVSVTLRFQLQPDGKLDGDPAIVEFPATPIGAAAAKSAMQAVKQCGPYHLPAAQYDQWKDIQLSLSP